MIRSSDFVNNVRPPRSPAVLHRSVGPTCEDAKRSKQLGADKEASVITNMSAAENERKGHQEAVGRRVCDITNGGTSRRSNCLSDESHDKDSCALENYC